MSALGERFDVFFQARNHLFADLDLPKGHVEDHREHRWSVDHGAVWWEDSQGRRRDASTTSHVFDKDGLYVVRDTQRHLWMVFSMDREDSNFEF